MSELLGLSQKRQAFLDETPGSNPVSDYADPARFEQERQRIFDRFPSIIAHASEIERPNSFLRRTIHDRPLLLLRGDDGQARLFLNVCRHRGTRLVDDEHGCKQRHSCPYHAWTWNSRGEFVNAPHFEIGFPGLDRSTLGLKSLPCVERHGFLWWLPEEDFDLDSFLGPIGDDLNWIDTAGLTAHQSTELDRHCNWKLLVEGGLEAYHFRVAHRNTIGDKFLDNLSSYECFEPHIRSILPRASMTSLASLPEEHWNIREHSNLLYTVFPTSALLVQSDHVIWIRWEPRSAEQSGIRLVTLVPKTSDRPSDYWDRNHAFTVKTLTEDFDLAQSMQSGMTSGANTVLNFGRFEGALSRFNAILRNALER